MPIINLDRIDYGILHHLQNDGRIANTELAERIGLSPSPCLRRVKALEQQGVIKRYVAIVDSNAVGFGISAFVSVSLNTQEKPALDEFQSQIVTYPEVMECYLMTGTSDYLLRVVLPDLESYERFLMEKLTKISVIANIQTSFALKPLVQRTELPLQIQG
ncbi:MAG: Lrp/AsnC family transcriptional regulator [Pseudomonadota bacterium]|nr:Lrp/AsnC family transcriptional regulator [Pseudomonadota bacterium]